MKKIHLIKIYRLVIITIILMTSLFIITSFSRAEDDDYEERGQEDYRPRSQSVLNQVKDQSPLVIPKNNAIQPKNINTNSIRSGEAAILAALIDSDSDGIPDVNDKHPGEDDFSYSLVDNNGNGIADDLEI